MDDSNLRDLIKSGVVMAFTISSALIWRDVIVEFIQIFVPQNGEFISKVIAAIIATAVSVLVIYLFLKTESRAEDVANRIRKKVKSK